jgi:predicted RNase H-like nuclease
LGAVLGIDPAWTAHNASGVALLVRQEHRWRCRAVAPSYESFYALANGRAVDWSSTPTGGAPSAGALLDAAESLTGASSIEVITVDMPIARTAFSSRRRADNAAAKVLSVVGCSVHSPSAERPGPVSTQLCEGFSARGYAVHTTMSSPNNGRPVLEVYPHPAAMNLLNETYRVPYKVAKTTKYFPGTSTEYRLERILEVWTRLLEALSRSIEGIDLPIPSPGERVPLARLKRFEDSLDALICAWVGTQFLEGRCRPLGDDDAAIWIPDVPGITRSQ